jgi:hypothetical protein
VTDLETLVRYHRATILKQAALASSLYALESWFYSAYWDFLTTADLRRVHGFLAGDPEIMALIVSHEPYETPY